MGFAPRLATRSFTLATENNSEMRSGQHGLWAKRPPTTKPRVQSPRAPPQRSATGSCTDLYARHLFLPVTGLSSIGILQLNTNSTKVVIRCSGKLLTGGLDKHAALEQGHESQYSREWCLPGARPSLHDPHIPHSASYAKPVLDVSVRVDEKGHPPLDIVPSA